MVLSESFIKTWVALQQRLISGLQSAYVDLRGSEVPSGSLIFTFPEKLEQPAELALAAELAQRSGAPVTGNGASGLDGSSVLRIAYPLHLGVHAEGAVVIEVEAPLERQAAILELLKWGEAWLNLALKQADTEDNTLSHGAVVVAGLAQDNYEDAVTASLAMVVDKVPCTRVALGRGYSIEIEAVSGVSDINQRSARVKAVQQAMQAALDAGKIHAWPQTGDDQAPIMLRKLVESHGLAGACAIPLTVGLSTPVVLLFEYAGERPWGNHAVQRCDEAAHVIAPLLELQRDRKRPWLRRLGALAGDGLRAAIAPGGRLRRGLLSILMIVFAWFAFSDADYRIAAPGVVEGAVQQATVAPFDGFIADAQVRAGQTVKKGDVMARLDDRELRSQRRRLMAEQDELEKQHRQAVATLDHSEAKIIEAQLAQTAARRALLDEQLERTELRAPLDGVIISGDWSRSLGAPVSRGDLLFEIAPLDRFRVSLQVSDRDIADLVGGQTGELVLTAMPRRPLPFSVATITAMAAEQSDEPAFRVEAETHDLPPSLRPGMQGVAKIKVAERPRWWVWTHSLTDWISLQLWRWLP